MLADRNDLKVSDPVVCCDSIDVVNVFRSKQGTAQMFLHHEPMDRRILPIDLLHQIASNQGRTRLMLQHMRRPVLQKASVVPLAQIFGVKRTVAKGACLIHGVLLTVLLAACQSQPKPCDCGLANAELMQYSQKYFHELAENGNLRQSLKACQEKKP